METKKTNSGGFRVEHDSMGSIDVENGHKWGAQTERSLQHFKIGEEKIPLQLIYAITTIKKAAALTNAQLNILDETVAEAIVFACDEILSSQNDAQFPLSVWQTGSGTQTNMNVNEVISYIASERLKKAVHPNDHVNMCQSTNDVFPSAIHIATVNLIDDMLLPAIGGLCDAFSRIEVRYGAIVKLGRTHLQDAVPMTFGQEVSGWRETLSSCAKMLGSAKQYLYELALGGTAVGTGLNAHHDFGRECCKHVAALTGKPFIALENKFRGLSSKDALVFVHGALKVLATSFMKIANDVRLLASGPRCGLGELTLPANEPGSSIMPGKVNPTQCEAAAMVCCLVMGNDVSVAVAASQGHLQLNAYMPVIAHCMVQSITLLSQSIKSFDENCVCNMVPNEGIMAQNVENSLMLATALSPHIGYENAAKVAKYAFDENITLKSAADALGLLTPSAFDSIMAKASWFGR